MELMNIWRLLRNIMPVVMPYRWLVVLTLVLTARSTPSLTCCMLPAVSRGAVRRAS